MSLGMCGLGAALGSLLTSTLTVSHERLLEFSLGTWEAAAALMLCSIKLYRFYYLLRLGLGTNARPNERWVQNIEGPCRRGNVCVLALPHVLELTLGSPYLAPFWTTHLHRQQRSGDSCTQGSPSGDLAVVTVSESSSQVLS